MSVARDTQYRLAMRALAVLGRHQGARSYFDAFGATIGVSAQQLIALSDQLHAAEQVRRATPAAAETVAELVEVLRGWTIVVSNRVPSLPYNGFGSKTMAGEDLINLTTKFIESIDAYEASTGVTLDFAEELRDEIRAKKAAAEAAIGSSGVIDAELTAMRRALHDATERFGSDLVDFRKAVAALLGRTHPDHRRLRAKASRRGGARAEGDAAGEAEGTSEADAGE